MGTLIKEEKYNELYYSDEKENSNDTDSSFTLFTPGEKYENGINILEGLAASGLRSIRYAQEVGGVKEIVANDYSSKAVECMRHNISHNEVSHLVTPSHNDAG